MHGAFFQINIFPGEGGKFTVTQTRIDGELPQIPALARLRKVKSENSVTYVLETRSRRRPFLPIDDGERSRRCFSSDVIWYFARLERN